MSSSDIYNSEDAYNFHKIDNFRLLCYPSSGSAFFLHQALENCFLHVTKVLNLKISYSIKSLTLNVDNNDDVLIKILAICQYLY